jgi:hypothetical protein
MLNFSNAVQFIASKMPGVISKESVGSLVQDNKITYDAAANIVASLDASGVSGATSTESTTAGFDISSSDVDKMVGVKATEHFFKDMKFQAMLDAIKKDDTMLYTEFVNLDKARERIAAQIVAKEENNFNMLLNEMKTTTGTNKDILDKLISTNLDVTEYGSSID